MADAELAAAPPAVQESLVEAKLFGKWDFSDVEVRQSAAEMPHNDNSAATFHWKQFGPSFTVPTPEQYSASSLPFLHDEQGRLLFCSSAAYPLDSPSRLLRMDCALETVGNAMKHLLRTASSRLSGSC